MACCSACRLTQDAPLELVFASYATTPHRLAVAFAPSLRDDRVGFANDLGGRWSWLFVRYLRSGWRGFRYEWRDAHDFIAD